MTIKRVPLEPNDAHILNAFREATEIWSEYQDVFEHAGPVSTNPILTDPDRFGRFCLEWAVSRTIRKGLRDQFRCTLRDDPEFVAALDDATGETLDRLHKNSLQPSFGTQNGRKGLISVTSKIATFIRPNSFTAWDRYAIAGLNLTLGRSKGGWFESYAEYIACFGIVRNGPHGQRLREIAKQSSERIQQDLRFQNRVLDLYLMRHGSYKGIGASKPTAC